MLDPCYCVKNSGRLTMYWGLGCGPEFRTQKVSKLGTVNYSQKVSRSCPIPLWSKFQSLNHAISLFLSISVLLSLLPWRSAIYTERTRSSYVSNGLCLWKDIYKTRITISTMPNNDSVNYTHNYYTIFGHTDHTVHSTRSTTHLKVEMVPNGRMADRHAQIRHVTNDKCGSYITYSHIAWVRAWHE